MPKAGATDRIVTAASPSASASSMAAAATLWRVRRGVGPREPCSGRSQSFAAQGFEVARYLRFGLLVKLARMKFPEGREGDIEASLAVARGVASPDYPFDDTVAHQWIERQVDSGPRDAKAQSRQIGAQWHGPKLRDLDKPTPVLHGDKDPIGKVSAGRDTAKRVPAARFVVFPGVGHDLPEALWPTVAAEARQNADRVASWQKP